FVDRDLAHVAVIAVSDRGDDLSCCKINSDQLLFAGGCTVQDLGFFIETKAEQRRLADVDAAFDRQRLIIQHHHSALATGDSNIDRIGLFVVDDLVDATLFNLELGGNRRRGHGGLGQQADTCGGQQRLLDSGSERALHVDLLGYMNVLQISAYHYFSSLAQKVPL